MPSQLSNGKNMSNISTCPSISANYSASTARVTDYVKFLCKGWNGFRSMTVISMHMSLQISLLLAVKLEHHFLMAMLAQSRQRRLRTDSFM